MDERNIFRRIAASFPAAHLATAFCAVSISLFLTAGMISVMQPDAGSEFNTVQRGEIRTIAEQAVHEELESLLRAGKIRSEGQVLLSGSMRKRLLDKETAYIAGAAPDTAQVAVIEFTDYHCSFCKRAAGFMQKLIADDPDVMVVFRELPVLGPESVHAATAALAARNQGKFLDLHFAMMNASGLLTAVRIEAIAAGQGLDTDLLEKETGNGRIRSILEENRMLAGEAGIDGTPAFVILSLDGRYGDIVRGLREDEIRLKIARAKEEYGQVRS